MSPPVSNIAHQKADQVTVNKTQTNGCQMIFMEMCTTSVGLQA
jgi:hypothetical protein